MTIKVQSNVLQRNSSTCLMGISHSVIWRQIYCMYTNVLNMSLFRGAQFICTIVSLFTSYRRWCYWLKSLMKPYKYIYDIWSFLLFIEHTSWCKSNQVSVLPNNTINFILMIIDYGIHLSSFSLLPQFECTILLLGIWILL